MINKSFCHLENIDCFSYQGDNLYASGGTNQQQHRQKAPMSLKVFCKANTECEPEYVFKTCKTCNGAIMLRHELLRFKKGKILNRTQKGILRGICEKRIGEG